MIKNLLRGFLALFLLVALFSFGRGLGLVQAIDGNEWWPLQTYHGPEVHVPVAKTASFTVSVNEYKYDIDASGGAVLASLPDVAAGSVPADGQCWKFTATVVGNAVTLSPSAVGDLLNGSQAEYAGMDAVGDSTEVCYDAGTTNYYFQSRFIN